MNMTSGSISDLLSRPRPWPQLSWRGRESYTKMVQFLDDADAIEQLKIGSFNGRIAQQYTNNLQKIQNPEEITVKDLLTGDFAVNMAKKFSNPVSSYNGVNAFSGTASATKRKAPNDERADSVTGSDSALTPGGSSAKKIPVSH